MPAPSDAVLRFAAAAVLQRVTWGSRPVDVPLARLVSLDHDEAALETIDGAVLRVMRAESAANVRSAARRWLAEGGEPVLAAVFCDEEIRTELDERPPDDGNGALTLVFPDSRETLGEAPWPTLIDVLLEGARRRGAMPEDVVDRLKRRLEAPFPASPSPAVCPLHRGVVAVLSEGLDLVRWGEDLARFRLPDGDTLHVLACDGSPDDDARIAQAFAWIAASLLRGDDAPHLIVVGGPDDLAERARSVWGSVVRFGHFQAIGHDGASRAPAALRDVVRLATGVPADHDISPALERGLIAARQGSWTSDASSADPLFLGRLFALRSALPGSRLTMLAAKEARLSLGSRILLVADASEPTSAEAALVTWQRLAAARRWSSGDADLVLLGGGSAARDAARRASEPLPGHLFHADPHTSVFARAGLWGRFGPVARALRASLSAGPTTFEDLKDAEEDASIQTYRSTLAERDFVDRLRIPTPWATYGLLAAIGLVWAFQLRWAGDGSFGVRGGAWAVRLGALTGEGPSNLELWRWWSHAFLHAGWMHLALNALALWALGGRLEALVGSGRFVALYLISCLGGALFHELSSSPGDVAVGSSGGIIGLLAAQGAIVLLRRDLVPASVRSMLWREVALNAVIIAMLSLLPFAGAMAHLGGALTGAAFAWFATLGVQPSSSGEERPTDVQEGVLSTASAAILGVLAAGSIVTAIVLGQPWALDGAGKVRDTAVFGGALTVPLPGSAGAPDERRGEDAWIVQSGDALRDGVRVEVRARRVGEDEVDLEALAALREPGPAWMRVRAGPGPALGRSFHEVDSLTDLWERGLHRSEWLVERDGVLFEVTVVGTRDVVWTRLAGSPHRIAAGLGVQDASEVPGPPAEVVSWRRALAGDDVPEPLLRGVARWQAGDQDGARAVWAEHVASPAWRSRAVAAAPYLPPEVALALTDAVLPAADAEQRVGLLVARSIALEHLERPAEALVALRGLGAASPGLLEAQLLWRDRQDAEAARIARAWLDEAVPGWVGLIARREDLAPGFRANLAWGMFLAGDPAGCAEESEAVVRKDPDNVVAAYNLAFCTLAAGDASGAERRYRVARATELEMREPRARAGARRDLDGLVVRGVAGAEAAREEWFP